MNLKTLFKLSYGLFVVSSKKNNRFNGLICNSVFQVTAEPPRVAVIINKENLTYQYINESKILTVSILAQDAPLKFIGVFGYKSGRDVDKFKDIEYKLGKLGVPIVLDYTVGYLELRIIDRLDVGTHSIFVGKLIDADVLTDSQPLTYQYYQMVKKGVVPEKAPTYQRHRVEKKGVKMKKYRCIVCGYIYDPEQGDPDSDIAPGTAFKDLPDNWVCPVCGADKSQFEEV